MKSFIIGLLVAAPLLIHNSLLAQPTQNRAEESDVAQKRQFIVADITGFPIGHTLSGSWQPLQSVRAGYGWQQSKWVELRLCADYTWFDFDDSEGWIYGGKYSKGKRHDLSVYPAIVLFNVAELALGCTYTTQDEVLNVPPLHLDSTPTPASTLDPAVKKIDIYAHFGLGSTIHIAGPVGLSLGLQFRANVPTDISVGCRAGIKVGI